VLGEAARGDGCCEGDSPTALHAIRPTSRAARVELFMAGALVFEVSGREILASRGIDRSKQK
jgi:hypothetical protein